VAARLSVLGAGSILPRAGYGCAGYALRPAPGAPVTLLDCGPGSVRMLGAVGIELTDVRRVVLSHYHPDHCADLLALAFARRNPAFAPVPPLELVGPAGLERVLAGFERAFGSWATDPDARRREVELDPRGGASLALDDLELRCVATRHSPEAVAWRVDLAGGGSLTYTGDTPETPEVAELARGSDLFVVECSFPDAEAVPNHLTPSSAGRLARAARPGAVLLTHFYPGLEPERAVAGAAEVFDGAIAAARDGSEHAFGPA